MASYSVARISVPLFKDHFPQPCIVFSCGSRSSRGGFRSGGDSVDAGMELPSPPSPSSSCSDTTSSAAEPPSPVSSTRRQPVLDRWVARQAREAVTTVERQAHEAELSALSAASQPVLARAATFRQRESPTQVQPQASNEVSPSSSRGEVNDLTRNVRASSLIQKWKELEADVSITSSPRLAAVDTGIEACDDSKWGGEVTSLSKHFTELAERCTKHEGDVATRNSSFGRSRSFSIHGIGEKLPFTDNRSLLPEKNNDSSLLKGTAHQPKKWRMIDDLLGRMRQERQLELGRLKKCHPVSKFPHRSRIQAMLRFWGPRRFLMMQPQELHDSTALELDSLRRRSSTICLLREQFSPSCQQRKNMRQAMHVKDTEILPQDNLLILGYSVDQPTTANSQEQDGTSEYQTILEENSSHSSSQGSQEDCQTDMLWQDNNLQTSNVMWQMTDDVVTEESGYNDQDILGDASSKNWMRSTSEANVRRGSYRQAACSRSDDNYPDIVDVQELLQRKPVSTSLASNFREIMDNMVLSLLRRLHYTDQGIIEEELEPVQRQGDGFIYATHVASSLPLLCQTSHSPVSQQGSWLTNLSSHHFETELMQDLRNEVAEIHQEMSELRKLLEICMHEKSKMQNLIREEVSSIIYSSADPNKEGNLLCLL